MSNTENSRDQSLTTTAFARAGLIGNPSDGFNGKTISIIVRNFQAEVTLRPSDQLEFLRNEDDDDRYDSIESLANRIQSEGYYGGTRLLKAAVKRFYEFTSPDNRLNADNFAISFQSNVPRQVGLAGSSAIITAALRGLMQWYDVNIPPQLLASLTLSVETELGIPAGLQDRVIQAYEGAVYMDFSASKMKTDKGLEFGHYERLDPSLLPKLYIAYAESAGEPTEVIHNNLRQRFNNGEPDVVNAMTRFAELAEEARAALLAGESERIHELVDQNFELRQSICKLLPEHIQMIETARSSGASGKNCGSGGAIIGTYRDESTFQILEKAMAKIGCKVIKPLILPV